MGRSCWRSFLAAPALGAAFALGATVAPAAASTDGSAANWALSEFGGAPAQRQMLFGGTPGVLMGTSPASLLFIGWRRLHGQTVGTAAGEALAKPCCGDGGVSDATTQWLAARKAVPGAAALDGPLSTERPGPNYTSAPNCLDDAFLNATRTLGNRVASYGADSPDVKFWLTAQDAVFAACATPGTGLPPLPDAAPAWLRADYRYQSAALDFYNGAFPAAADDFAAIAADGGSPWHDIAPYLRVRALLRKALASKAPADFTVARDAARAVPPAAKLADMAELRADPAAAAARLVSALGAPEPSAQAASDFKDLQSLKGTANDAAQPELLDWITTIKTGAAAPPDAPPDTPTKLDGAKAAEIRRVAALAHAQDRYGATHDVAWLLAALALMQPDEAAGTPLLAAAAALDPQAPAYLTALFHRVRLLNGTADPATLRPLLDAALARTDLTATARNLFLAERLQVSTSLADLATFTLRQRQCGQDSDGCDAEAWGFYGTGPGLFDGDAEGKGVGDDARYLIDRMALPTRMALSGAAPLPAPIRMDIALTSFARAVLAHDDAAADALAGPLQALLPAMAAEFAAVPKARPGPDKLFAEYFVFAKIPGLRADLLDYTRPTGEVADFTGNWPNWVVLAKPDPDAIPPGPALYDNAGYQVLDVPAGTDLGNGHRRIPDAVCDGMCGAGGFVPRMPAFLADTAAKATAERRFLPPPGKYGDAGTMPNSRAEAFPSDVTEPVQAQAAPPGATYMWEYVLDYAAKHPQDPRSPEALHWLIHVGHYGQGHDHSGRRAFMLLHSRYPNSPWAKQNPFFYD